MTYEERMHLAMEAARKSGEMLTRTAELHIDRKAKNDYVTDADKASERLIRGILLDACPEDGFFGEESGASGAENDGTWVVDPIDGTTNFIRKLAPYTISIAYMQGGQPRAAAIYAPLTGEMFSAYEGGGAFLNGAPIHAAETTDPDDCILGLSFAHRHPAEAQRMFRLIPRLAPKINDLRRLGSAAYDLCCVACGRYDAFIERKLYIYDIAAGVLIAREAGARVSGWPDGEDCLITGDVFAAAPGLADWLRDQLIDF